MSQRKKNNISYFFEKNKEIIPTILRFILEECGFNTLSCMKDINADVIREIEEYVTSNKYIIENHIFDDTPYRKQVKFQLLPGHRMLLLNLPKKLEEINNFKQQTTQKPWETRDTSELDSNKENNKNVNNTEEDDELKKKLINRITTSITGIKLKISSESFTTSNIVKFDIYITNNQLNCKSVVKCPLCEKCLCVSYKKYWYISSFDQHLKTHIPSTSDTKNYIPETSKNIQKDTLYETGQYSHAELNSQNVNVDVEDRLDLDANQEVRQPFELVENNVTGRLNNL